MVGDAGGRVSELAEGVAGNIYLSSVESSIA